MQACIGRTDTAKDGTDSRKEDTFFLFLYARASKYDDLNEPSGREIEMWSRPSHGERSRLTDTINLGSLSLSRSQKEMDDGSLGRRPVYCSQSTRFIAPFTLSLGIRKREIRQSARDQFP